MKKTSRSLFVLRYGIGGVMCVAGIVLLATDAGGFGVDGFALGVGAGLSLIMLNFLYRLGVSGDRERDQEEDARTYLELHGYWPDEADEHRPPAAPAADEHRPPAARVRELSRPTKITPPRTTEPHVDRFARR
jgi:hypothetical protein